MQILELDDEDTIQMKEAKFHTHSSIEATEYETTPEKGVRKMIEAMMAGRLLLIEETEPGKEPLKLVRPSLERYLKYKPENAQYKIYNET